jgi:archaellum component FlaF (FlaF/FlaG flagellin family)
MACGLPGLVQRNVDVEDLIPTGTAGEPSQTAPKPTLQPPTPIVKPDQDCLTGTWEITNLSDYILAAIPADLAEKYDLQYNGSSGKATFTFTPDGSITLNADQIVILFDAKVSIITLSLKVRIDGSATGKYILTDSSLTTTNMNTAELNASAKAAGQDVIDPAQVINAIPLVKSPYNVARSTCEDDSLQLKLQAYPESIPALTFQRVKA